MSFWFTYFLLNRFPAPFVILQVGNALQAIIHLLREYSIAKT